MSRANPQATIFSEEQFVPRANRLVIKKNNQRQKARILELKRRYFEDYYSGNQYVVSIKEDTAYPCLHSLKTTKETSPICRIQESQYAVFKLYGNKIFWKISNVVPTPRNSNTPYPMTWIRRSADFNDFLTRKLGEDGSCGKQWRIKIWSNTCARPSLTYGGVARPKLRTSITLKLKGPISQGTYILTASAVRIMKDAKRNHLKKVLEIVDLFHIPNITIDQVMLRAFPMSLTGAASHWLRNEPTGSITTWDGLKTKFLNKYCPPARTAKKMEEINNFQQEPDENLYQAWERFKELLMKCPQHYLTEMQEVILFYNGLGIPTRQILDSRGAIPSKTAADAKVAIQEMAEYSQKWHNGTSRSRSTETSDGLAAIQAQLNNLGREIKKVNEKVYAAQVGCEQCKGPHYTKDCPLKEEGKTLEEAYYTQFGGPFQGGGYRAAAPGFYQRNNANPSYQERRQSMEDTLSKFMSESAKRHEENSNLIKEIRASTDAAIRNQGASWKFQIGQMRRVLQESGF
ncbi:hypothetical protein Tco_1192912 [Tanacetum coccineum]